ncbi:MAG: GNAT family N-acetyltransferase [Hymenobacter sp.]
MEIPVLETARLRLRGHYPTDLPAFLAMWQQPAFYQHLTGTPLPEEEVWTKMLRHAGLWYLQGYGYWAVEEKATGEFIGAVGFGAWQRAITPSLKGWPEIGWVLAPTPTAGATPPRLRGPPWSGATRTSRSPARCALSTWAIKHHWPWRLRAATRSLAARCIRAFHRAIGARLG